MMTVTIGFDFRRLLVCQSLVFLVFAFHANPARAGDAFGQSGSCMSLVERARSVPGAEWPRERARMLDLLIRDAGLKRPLPDGSEASVLDLLDAAHGLKDAHVPARRTEIVRRLQIAAYFSIDAWLSSVLARSRSVPERDWPTTKRMLLARIHSLLVAFGDGDEAAALSLKQTAILLDEARGLPHSASGDVLREKLQRALQLVPLVALDAAQQAVEAPDARWPEIRSALLEKVRILIRPSSFEQWSERIVRIGAFLDECHSVRPARPTPIAVPNGYKIVRHLQWLIHPSEFEEDAPVASSWGDPWWLVLLVICGLAVSPLKKLAARVATSDPRWRWPVRFIMWGTWGLLCLELMARFILSSDVLFTRIAGDDATSARIRFVRSHGLNDEGHFVATHAYMDPHPLRGWTVKPRVTDFISDYGKIVNSNSFGMRGTVEYSLERPADRTRILAFGDSYTFGEEESDDETYPYHLQRRLPDAEVLNMGVSGYALDQIYLYLRDEAMKFHPQVVLLSYVSYDSWRSHLTFTYGPKPRFRLVGHALHLEGVPVPDPETVLATAAWHSSLVDLWDILRSRSSDGFGASQETNRELASALLDRMVAVIRGIDATPVIVYLPLGREASGEFRSQVPLVQSFCAHSHVLFWDVSDAIRKAIKQGRFRARQWLPGHWTSAEADVVAADVAAFLLRSGVMSKPSDR